MKSVVLIRAVPKKGVEYFDSSGLVFYDFNDQILGVYDNLSYANKRLMEFKKTGEWLDLRCETWQLQEDNVPPAQ